MQSTSTATQSQPTKGRLQAIARSSPPSDSIERPWKQYHIQYCSAWHSPTASQVNHPAAAELPPSELRLFKTNSELKDQLCDSSVWCVFSNSWSDVTPSLAKHAAKTSSIDILACLVAGEMYLNAKTFVSCCHPSGCFHIVYQPHYRMQSVTQIRRHKMPIYYGCTVPIVSKREGSKMVWSDIKIELRGKMRSIPFPAHGSVEHQAREDNKTHEACWSMTVMRRFITFPQSFSSCARCSVLGAGW